MENNNISKKIDNKQTFQSANRSKNYDLAFLEFFRFMFAISIVLWHFGLPEPLNSTPLAIS